MTALTLPALTVRQPWASLIALGVKRYETRGWRPRSLGPDRLLAIHAGRGSSTPGSTAWLALLAAHPGEDCAPLGVLCVVEVEDVLPSLGVVDGQARLGLLGDASETARDGYRVLSPEETALGDYASGRWAWRLRVVERFVKPISARGAQGLWRWTRPGAAGGAT